MRGRPIIEDGSREDGVAHVGLGEHRPLQVRAVEVDALHPGLVELGSGQDGVLEAGRHQPGLVKLSRLAVRLLHPGFLQVRPRQASLLQLDLDALQPAKTGPLEVRPPQPGEGEVGSLQRQPSQVDPIEVGAGQIERDCPVNFLKSAQPQPDGLFEEMEQHPLGLLAVFAPQIAHQEHEDRGVEGLVVLTKECRDRGDGAGPLGRDLGVQTLAHGFATVEEQSQALALSLETVLLLLAQVFRLLAPRCFPLLRQLLKPVLVLLVDREVQAGDGHHRRGQRRQGGRHSSPKPSLSLQSEDLLSELFDVQLLLLAGRGLVEGDPERPARPAEKNECHGNQQQDGRRDRPPTSSPIGGGYELITPPMHLPQRLQSPS